jgi:hypothetical protein
MGKCLLDDFLLTFLDLDRGRGENSQEILIWDIQRTDVRVWKGDIHT